DSIGLTETAERSARSWRPAAPAPAARADGGPRADGPQHAAHGAAPARGSETRGRTVIRGARRGDGTACRQPEGLTRARGGTQSPVSRRACVAGSPGALPPVAGAADGASQCVATARSPPQQGVVAARRRPEPALRVPGRSLPRSPVALAAI